MRLVVLFSLLLVGCASGQWTRGGSDAAQLEADLAACEYQAIKAAAACERPFEIRRRGVRAICTDPELQSACMRAKGYRYVIEAQ